MKLLDSLDRAVAPLATLPQARLGRPAARLRGKKVEG